MKSAFSSSKKLIKYLSITLLFSSIFLGPIGNVYAQPPTITSFSPASGAVGTLVAITGTNLGSPTDFSIGGVSAIIVSNSGTSLVGMVMPGSTTGVITFTSTGGTTSGGSNFTITSTQYPITQQGAKLVGTGNTGNAYQGTSVSVSGDGNTAIVGGFYDNTSNGAAWVYTRNLGVWTQQGEKLVGSGNFGIAGQGISVSLSADGNTAIVGGFLDNGGQGAAWVFSRSGGVWSQQGNKLVGTGNAGAARQGFSVSLSADGNTCMIGGYSDNSDKGAAWVFTRSGGVWNQLGSKLVGTGSRGAARQGYSVSLSADGKTAIVGGTDDNGGQGAAWVYSRSGNTWEQQGAKLVGTGVTSAASQGFSVSLSAEGNTALVGGSTDNFFQGAFWVFTRSGSSWTQQGSKLMGSGNKGPATQGFSVSLSADGNMALIGGKGDNSSLGAAWVFFRNGGVWMQKGDKVVGVGNTGSSRQGFSVSMSADGNTFIIGGESDNSYNGAAWIFVSVPKLYFRSIQSGNWNDPTTWESSPFADFSSGLISPATLPPGVDANGINIREGHNVSLTQNVSVRQIFVHPASTLSIIGCTLTQLEN